jgi:hypothetical protein
VHGTRRNAQPEQAQLDAFAIVSPSAPVQTIMDEESRPAHAERERSHAFVLSFPSVCPEPVLVNCIAASDQERKGKERKGRFNRRKTGVEK